METSQKIQERNLDILVRNGGFEFTDSFFPYTSGEIGPYYVQSAVVMKNGSDYWQATQDLSKLIFKEMGQDIHDNLQIISSGETRDWIFSFPLIEEISVPQSMLYKNGKIIGADMNGKKVIHVADLNNEGSSPRDYWVPMIKEAGGEINDIFFYVDRMESGVQVMEDLGLKSHSVVPLDKHAWDYLQEKDVVSAKVYWSLRGRMEDKGVWAKNMLRSEKGLETLAKLSKDHPEKAIKILTNGYPDMEEELKSGLLKKHGLNVKIRK